MAIQDDVGIAFDAMSGFICPEIGATWTCAAAGLAKSRDTGGRNG